MSNQKIYTNVSVRGDNVLYRGYENGKRVSKKIPFRPTLFVPSNGKKTEFTTLYGEFVEPFQPGSISDCREFINQYDDVSGFAIYGNTDYLYQFIGEEYPTTIDFTPENLRVAYIDIETKCEEGFPDVSIADEEINVITVRMGTDICTFGVGVFDAVRDGHNNYCFKSEPELLKSFLDYWDKLDPDIITGWNINFFDVPYMIRRITRVLGEKEAKRLSPWRQIKERIVTVMQRDHTVYDLVGISTLDYFDLYRKLTFTNRESYKLDHIAYVELGERKIGYGEYSSLHEFYSKNFQKFIEYNVKDVDLVVRLEEKLKLIELALTLAYSAKVNHIDIFSQVKTWDQIIYHHLREKNIVIPMKKPGHKDDQFAGAYVKEPIIGMHKWVVSYDLNSLYPLLIAQYNISPETKIKQKQNIDIDRLLDSLQMNSYQSGKYSIAANGVSFRKDIRGFLPDLMETLYHERTMYKNKMLDSKRSLREIENEIERRKIV